MTTKFDIEKAIKEVLEVFNRFAEPQKQELLTAVQKTLQDEKESWAGKLGLIVFLMILIALIFSVPIYANNVGYYRELSADNLFQLIAFVFALSSYLASVARETAKTLSDAKKHDYEKYIKIKKNIFCMLSAEMPLILLGVLAILRLIIGPYAQFIPCINQCVSLDAFLLSFLATILLRMVYLHTRIWWSQPAWRYDKNK